MLVKGVTEEIFQDIKPFVTIYPSQGRLVINLNTARSEVLKAFARNFSGAATNTDASDADALVEKILTYRRGDDGLEATTDDCVVDMTAMPLTAKGKVIFLLMAQSQTKASRYIRAQVKGWDTLTSIATSVEAVIDREDLSVVFWRRQQ